MSYEGYVMQLCARGHLRRIDAYDDYSSCRVSAASLCNCGSEIVWRQSIDCTNGEEEEPELEIETPTVLCTCPTCDNVHVVERPRYKIPGRQKP